jgi:hypothetical protein
LLTASLKILCKVHGKVTLAVTGVWRSQRMPASVGQARRRNCIYEKTTLLTAETLLSNNIYHISSCGDTSVYNGKTVGLVHTAYGHVQHSPPHDSTTARSSEAAVCPRRANAEDHPSPHQRSWIYLWAHTSHSRFLPISTATLALIVLAEQRYKLKSRFSYLQRFPTCHYS